MSIFDFPYKVLLTLPNTDTDHIDRWCSSHFGDRGGIWECWFANDSLFNFDMYYAFIKQEDAVLFTLRWV